MSPQDNYINFPYPVNFQEKDRHIFYFLDEPEPVYSPTLQRLKNAYFHVGTHKVLKSTPKNILKRILASIHIKYQVIQVEEALVRITDEYSANYFHWINDALPKLMLLEREGIKARVIMPESLKSFGFIRQSLELLGWAFDFYSANTVLHCKHLYLPEATAPSGSQHPVYFKMLINRLTTTAAYEGVPTRKVFISRRNSPYRNLEPWSEIELILLAHGYEIVQTETMSLKEQIQLFWQTKHLIAVHGAGLTNMAFMQAGNSVTEIRREDDLLNYCYFKMASICGQHYSYAITKGEKGTVSVQEDNFWMESEKLLDIINKIVDSEL